MFHSRPGEVLLRFWHWPVAVLGPGRRLGLWFQGCSIRCPGCVAPENQPFDPAFSVPIDDLMEELAPVLDAPEGPPGVTISGGEPLDQREALLVLLERLNARGARDVLVYSGYPRERALADCPDLSRLAAALVDGPFVEGAATDAPWKGSENQGLAIFRDEFRKDYELWSSGTERRMQMARKGASRYLIGIPRQGDGWRERLRKEVGSR